MTTITSGFAHSKHSSHSQHSHNKQGQHTHNMVLALASPAVMLARIPAAALTWPTLASLQQVLLATGMMYLGFAVGVQAGIFRWEPLNAGAALGWSVVYMAARSLAEEAIFRGLLLPNPKVDGKDALAPAFFAQHAIVPLIMFVLSHAWTTQRRPGTVLSDTKFLGTVTALGAACTWVYWMTGGQLWSAVLLHWLVTFPYMVLMGGHRKTHTPTMLKVERAAERVRRDMAPAPVQESEQTKRE